MIGCMSYAMPRLFSAATCGCTANRRRLQTLTGGTHCALKIEGGVLGFDDGCEPEAPVSFFFFFLRTRGGVSVRYLGSVVLFV